MCHMRIRARQREARRPARAGRMLLPACSRILGVKASTLIRAEAFEATRKTRARRVPNLATSHVLCREPTGLDHTKNGTVDVVATRPAC